MHKFNSFINCRPMKIKCKNNENLSYITSDSIPQMLADQNIIECPFVALNFVKIEFLICL